MHKLAKSVTKTSSKVQKSKAYNKIITNFIQNNKWYKVVNKELLNLYINQA